MHLWKAPYWLCQYGLLHFRHFARLLRQRRHAGVGNALNSHQTDENDSFWGALFRYRSIRAFDALFRYRSIRAFDALFRYRSIRALAPAMCSFHCAHTPTQPGYCPLGNTPCPFLGWLRRQSDRSKVFVEFMHISHKYIHFVTNVLKYARFERCHRSFSLDVQGYT